MWGRRGHARDRSPSSAWFLESPGGECTPCESQVEAGSRAFIIPHGLVVEVSLALHTSRQNGSSSLSSPLESQVIGRPGIGSKKHLKEEKRGTEMGRGSED